MTSHNIAASEVIQQCLVSVQAWEETALRARQADREAPCCKSSQRVIKVTLSIPLQRRKCLKGKAASAWLLLPLTQYAATWAGYNLPCCSSVLSEGEVWSYSTNINPQRGNITASLCKSSHCLAAWPQALSSDKATLHPWDLASISLQQKI